MPSLLACEPTLTIDPLRWRYMMRSAALVPTKVASTLTVNTRRHSSRVISTVGLKVAAKALPT